MPYNPQIQPQASESGFAAFGQGFNPLLLEAIKRYQQTQKEQAFSDQVVQGLAKNPQTQKYLMGDKDATVADALDRYTKMGHNQKQGYSQGIMATMAADLQQQKAAQDASQLKFQAPYQQAMTEEARARANLLNRKATETGELDPVVTDPLVVDGKPVPGIGTNRKTGQYVYFGQEQNGSPISFDEKTGVPFYRTSKGEIKPLKIEDVQAASAYKKSQQPTNPNSGGIMNWFSNAIGKTMPGTQPKTQLPQPGEVRGKWKFKGGDPADQGSWEPVQ